MWRSTVMPGKIYELWCTWDHLMGCCWQYIKTLLDVYLLRSNFATLYQQAGTATGTSTSGVYSCAMLFCIGVVYSSDVGCLRCLSLLVGNAKA